MTQGHMGSVGGRPAVGSSGPPSYASKLGEWWADDLAGANGSSVTAWPDRVAALSMAAPATAPVLRPTGGPNSRQCVEFGGGATEYMRAIVSGWSSFAGVILMIGKVTTPSSGAPMWSVAYANSNSYWLYAGPSGTWAYPEIQGTTSSGNIWRYGNTSMAANTWYLVEWSSSGTVSTCRLNNATQSMNGSGGNGYWFSTVPNYNQFTIGALKRSSLSAPVSGMSFAYVGVASAELSAGDRTSFRDWAASYYGLALS